ncbi:hypothetical protein PA905_23710 [Planktothrix agardhii CCAP 1459/11A]|uniref:ParA family protein n=1 Tax=Planktothrix agardhii CCAP 1459/11A TaxID=282420 RepID=A0A4P5ZEC0_PLAAG|nr:ParA family protein [Planktothrix agardhii]GDZ94416.1 hypothetical protein PA905_23710 [Planktothrix agardhii CCAP 1459/11A]
MKFMRLLTWFDVQRVIRRETSYGSQLPDGVVRINCFSDALEIGISNPECQPQINTILKEWFGDWYQEEQFIIQLDIGDSTLPVEFSVEDNFYQKNIVVRPFWEEIAYLESDPEVIAERSKSVHLPEKYETPPGLIAFYSFKGGVGRTLHLAAHLFALLEKAKEIDKAITILVIDADLEAPGLTYWNRAQKQQPTLSFIDFLESYHYSPIDREQTLSFLAKEIKKSSKSEGKSTVYFLPACLNDHQLLDTPILPEQLVRTLDGTWECGNALHRLGHAVGADYIFIDLRAGLSEISSPIIFDPRIQRFIITTITEQSISGTSLVLEQIGRVAPPENSINDQQYYDPSLIINMLMPELKQLPAFEDALVRFQSAYIQSEEDNLYSTRLQIKETYFAQELLYINNWEEARAKLSPTSVMKVAFEWANEQLYEQENQDLNSGITNQSDPLSEVQKLMQICEKYEYAEQGEGEDLLVTEPLKNLATQFQDDLPRVVSIGAKGAGKTFNYIQLSRFKYWENFLQKILQKIDPSQPLGISKTYIFPLLESRQLSDQAKNIINEARNEVQMVIGDEPSFKSSECVGRIKTAISQNSGWSEPEWTEFWIQEMARVIGINVDQTSSLSLSTINHELKDKSLKIIFLFDGLEDIFSDIASNSQQKMALKSLIEDLPNKLSEIRQSNLGVIIFLRRDFLRYTITQNLGQFENLYRSYDLYWNQDSFLKLVFWLCTQSKIIGAEQINIESFSQQELIEKLQDLWGKRLGSDHSKEAYSYSWIFAALTDFNGRLQARDIVRFLYNAAKITVEQSNNIQFEKWSTSRLLPPQSIRKALKPCSEKKVEEAKEEYPEFNEWVKTLGQYGARIIPFSVEQFGMEPKIVRILEDMGVIYEDKEKEDIARFYMPEIFREGLGFSGTGARPRVLALKRKVLGRGII